MLSLFIDCFQERELNKEISTAQSDLASAQRDLEKNENILRQKEEGFKAELNKLEAEKR